MNEDAAEAPGERRWRSPRGDIRTVVVLDAHALPRQKFRRPLLSVLAAAVFACELIPAATCAPPFHDKGVTSTAASTSVQPAFVIRMKNGRTKFRQGETITLELGYGADPQHQTSHSGVLDEPGLAVDELHLEPHVGVGDPLRNYLASLRTWDGPPPRHSPFVVLRGRWTAIDINEWFSFDRPGKHRLTARAQPVRNLGGALMPHRLSDDEITSNSLEFEVISPDLGWELATLHQAEVLLQKSDRRGCRILRFLGTDRAAAAMVRYYADHGECASDFAYGLLASPDRQQVERRMEEGILDPAVAISAEYFDTLARLSAYVEHPDYLPSNDAEQLGTMKWHIGGPLADHYDVIQAQQDRHVMELIGALESKVGWARAQSLKAIFDSRVTGQPTLLKSIDPTLLTRLRGEIAAIFAEFSTDDQFSLLGGLDWPNIASPAMIPVLEQLYRNPPPGYNERITGAVLDDLYSVAPTEARTLILRELVLPHPRIDPSFDRLLPDQEIPELDEPLAGNLEASKGTADAVLEVIGRYATPVIFPRVRALEEDRLGKMGCAAQAALLAYAMRSDPVFGRELLEKALGARKSTRCCTNILFDAAPYHMSPDLEQAAIAHLNDPNLDVEDSAISLLQVYGSAAAEAPLWDRLEKLHATWKPYWRILPNGTVFVFARDLDASLIDALAKGQGWLAGPKEFARLAKLCDAEDDCHTVQWLAEQYSEPPLIDFTYISGDQCWAHVNQYEFESLDALKHKLAQFPRGTAFRWQYSGDQKDGERILGELRSFFGDRGMTIR
jgi:hypothetical protein